MAQNGNRDLRNIEQLDLDFVFWFAIYVYIYIELHRDLYRHSKDIEGVKGRHTNYLKK